MDRRKAGWHRSELGSLRGISYPDRDDFTRSSGALGLIRCVIGTACGARYRDCGDADRICANVYPVRCKLPTIRGAMGNARGDF
jgi:hypothetical protein